MAFFSEIYKKDLIAWDLFKNKDNSAEQKLKECHTASTGTKIDITYDFPQKNQFTLHYEY